MRVLTFLIVVLAALVANADPQARYRDSDGVALNDRTVTPGATLDVSLEELCTPGYTTSVRNVTTATKKKACASYGVTSDHCNGREVEIDHLISLELGGSNDLKNLWPQPYQPKPGAREKDRVENWLHQQVCDGTVGLADAQQQIASDWYAVYSRMSGATQPSAAPLTSTASVLTASGATGTGSASTTTLLPPATAGAEGAAWDFAISEDYLAQLEAGHSIQPTLTMQMGDHSAVHKLDADCEMHAAAHPQGATLGSPNDFVVEPPNVCQNGPSAAGASASDWPSVFDGFNGKTCQITGFPRIFTEHASGTTGASNPNHVFEIHPMTGLSCGGPKLSFIPLLRFYSGMRAISPATTSACISQRHLFVRFDVDRQQYVFREQGGRCGNFAIVEVQNVLASSVRAVGDGHSAIARISPDGQSITTLKIYTLSPSAEDTWLTNIGPGSNGGPRVLLHGLFTYDYFAIQRTVHPKGGDWQRPQDWTPISFPLAFIVFGQADAAPWGEE